MWSRAEEERCDQCFRSKGKAMPTSRVGWTSSPLKTMTKGTKDDDDDDDDDDGEDDDMVTNWSDVNSNSRSWAPMASACQDSTSSTRMVESEKS